jgi:hypothetical protein
MNAIGIMCLPKRFSDHPTRSRRCGCLRTGSATGIDPLRTNGSVSFFARWFTENHRRDKGGKILVWLPDQDPMAGRQ